MRMNKEEVVSAFVMTVVSALVLIGFTVAWYTKSYATVTGMQMLAAGQSAIKVALESGESAKDVKELAEEGIYADIHLEKLTNVNEKMVPGAFGTVTFYITPQDKNVYECNILPVVAIKQGDEEWYFEKDDEDMNNVSIELADLYEKVQNHIEFFADESMTIKIDKENPYVVEWTQQELMAEKKADIYWKWHYEYPFNKETQEQLLNMSESDKKELIDNYDLEDIAIGQNVSNMKMHFTFSIK